MNRRKRIEVTVQVYADVDEHERATIIGAGHPLNGMPWERWVAALKRLGCVVNEHWHTVEERGAPAPVIGSEL